MPPRSALEEESESEGEEETESEGEEESESEGEEETESEGEEETESEGEEEESFSDGQNLGLGLDLDLLGPACSQNTGCGSWGVAEEVSDGLPWVNFPMLPEFEEERGEDEEDEEEVFFNQQRAAAKALSRVVTRRNHNLMRNALFQWRAFVTTSGLEFDPAEAVPEMEALAALKRNQRVCGTWQRLGARLTASHRTGRVLGAREAWRRMGSHYLAMLRRERMRSVLESMGTTTASGDKSCSVM